jgi:SAM-dependent methyltransferase
MRTHQLSHCPVCGSSAAVRLGVGPAWHLRNCVACGTFYASAYADPDDLYVDGYLCAAPPLLVDGEPVADLAAAGPGLDIHDPTFQRYLTGLARRRLRILQRAARPPGALLDVGCGTGEFLAAARHRGWTVAGVDPVADAAAFCREERGLDVRTGLLQEVGLPPASFDVVCASHVLEHMPKATEFLELLSRWARPGGHVLVEVPNYRGVQRKAMGADWPGLRPLEHVVYFSSDSLRTALVRAGLTPIVMRAPSYVGPPQDLHQALGDLGQSRLQPLLSPLCRRPRGGDDELVFPTAALWAALRAIDALYDRFRVGMVLVAVGRVPVR